jgi:hypothetical protein
MILIYKYLNPESNTNNYMVNIILVLIVSCAHPLLSPSLFYLSLNPSPKREGLLSVDNLSPLPSLREGVGGRGN